MMFPLPWTSALDLERRDLRGGGPPAGRLMNLVPGRRSCSFSLGSPGAARFVCNVCRIVPFRRVVTGSPNYGGQD